MPGIGGEAGPPAVEIAGVADGGFPDLASPSCGLPIGLAVLGDQSTPKVAGRGNGCAGVLAVAGGGVPSAARPPRIPTDGKGDVADGGVPSVADPSSGDQSRPKVGRRG